jgi:hypothetical protein
MARDPTTRDAPPVQASAAPHQHARRMPMFIRAPNYYFQKVMNDIQREIDVANPERILVEKADWDVIKDSIPAHRYTLTQATDTSHALLITKDEYGWERTFELVPPDQPPSGTLNLTGRRRQQEE